MASAALLSLALLALPPAGHTTAPLPLHQAQATAQDPTQAEVVTRLQAYVAFCDANAKAAYRADCLAERFDQAARQLGQYGDTADLYQALKAAAQDMSDLARRYADPDLPPLALSSPDFATNRPIQPVAAANLATANAAATQVLEETALTLLRSAARRPDVLAFQQAAQVIGTAKVLLRAG